jgi:hypothetical protein
MQKCALKRPFLGMAAWASSWPASVLREIDATLTTNSPLAKKMKFFCDEP